MSQSPFGPAPGPPSGGSRKPSAPGFGGSPLPPAQHTPRTGSAPVPRQSPSPAPVQQAPPPPRQPRRLRPIWRITSKLSPSLMSGLLLGALLILFLRWPIWQIQQVVALGGEFTEEELNTAFQIDTWKGDYFWTFLLDHGQAMQPIREHPRVADATWRFVPPGRMELHLREKERYAALVEGETAYIIATDFSCMGSEPVGLVQMSRVMAGISPAILYDDTGKVLRDPFPIWPPQPTRDDMDRYYYAKLLQLCRWMDVETNPPWSQVAGLSVDRERGITLHYRLGPDQYYPPILLGSGAELESKYGQALTLYRSGMFRDRTDAEIDLRFNRAVVRTIGQAALEAEQGWLSELPRDYRTPGTMPVQPASAGVGFTEESL